MNIKSDDSVEEFVLNLTPMIDVVFLLLIFFMVSTTFMNQEAQIDVELPKAESGAEATPTPDEITLTISEAGQVYHDGVALAPEPLLELLRAAAQHDPETPVTIRGHRAARHEAIVGVMDACGLAGLSNLAIGTSTDGTRED
jgi:biopolymer transport protein ExbD